MKGQAMRVEVYGMSDDCLEVEGDLMDEFGAYGGPHFLHFSDGTVLEAEYCPPDDDTYYWRIKTHVSGSGTKIARKPGTYDGEDGRKCDKLILIGDLGWVECWGSADGPTRENIKAFFERMDGSTLSQSQAKRIMAIVREGSNE